MTQWLTQEILKLQQVAEGGVVLLVILVVIATYAKTKAIVPTLGALVFGFVVIWAVHNTGWFETRIGQEFNGLAPTLVLAGRT